MDLNREEAQRILHEMKRDASSSSLQHREKAPDQSYTNASFQKQGRFLVSVLHPYFGQ